MYDYVGSEELYQWITMTTKTQDDLNWKLFLEGKIVKTWAHLQEKHYRLLTKCSRKGATWETDIIILLQNFIHAMWKSRNNVLHNNNKKEYITKEQELLNHKIQQEYDTHVPICQNSVSGNKNTIEYPLV